MKNLLNQRSTKRIMLLTLISLASAMSTPALSVEKKDNKEKINTQAPINMNEPSPLYLVVMKQWAVTTNFAADSANVIVQKLKMSMEQDPEVKKILTPAFIADLQQFIYELFISNDAITALAKVYSDYFTIDEMQDLLIFYNTPLGKKLVKAEPELVIKTQEVGINLLKKNQRAYMELIAKYTGRKLPEQAPPQVEGGKPVEVAKPAEVKTPEVVKPVEPIKQAKPQPTAAEQKPENKSKEPQPWWKRLLSKIGVTVN